VFVHLSSSAPNSRKQIQASISEVWTQLHDQAEPCAYCYNLNRLQWLTVQMWSIWAEQEFNESLLLVLVVKDPQVL